MEAHQKSPGTAGGREDGADLGEGVALEVLEDGDVEVQSLSLTEGPTKSADLEAGRTLTNENLTRGPLLFFSCLAFLPAQMSIASPYYPC